jgi:hypothetical protein
MLSTRVSRLARGRGGLVTVGTITALLLGIGATLFGLGAADNAIANFDAASWLWSNNKGEVARVNGVTGRVDTRYKVSDSLGHTVQVSQTDRYVILRDLTTGKVSVLDLASLQLAATTQTTAGLGVTVALHGDAAFVIDAVQGTVGQLDPATLAPVGTPLRFMPGLSGGTFDADGRLWLLVAGEGTVVAIEPAKGSSGKPGKDGGTGGSAAGDPKVVRTVPIADPSHDLAMSVLDKGVAVLDKTGAVLTTLRGDQPRTIPLTLTGPGAMPVRTNGADVPVTVVDDRNVYLVTGDKVAQFTVPGESAKLKPCVSWSKRLYCPDEATGNVYVLDAAGKLTATITVPGATGAPLDLEVREDHLFINAPNASNAEVVDNQGHVKLVDKYANNVLGGDPPPPVPPPPPKPPVGLPGAPVNVRAAPGNAQVRVSWNPAPANGAPILKYVVEGDGKRHEVGASQQSLDVTGLVNGQQYTFSVFAVNAQGNGPKRAANPVVPTAEVPDAPTAVTAAENKDGTVTVTWPAANGQGRTVTRYLVSAVSAGGPPVQVAESDKPTATIPAGQLAYGTQYAFSVVAVNDKGGNSKPSPLSNTVVPFAVPGALVGLKAVAATDKAGTVTVSWTAPPENGRPITKYVVTAAGKGQDVVGATSTTLAGLGNGTKVDVKVHAVNPAGDGPDATATATTIRKPTVTVTGSSANQTSITATFSADLGGAANATCTLNANNTSQTGACSSITLGGLRPSTGYDFTVVVTTPAGASDPGTGRQATQDVTGVAFCENQPGSSEPAAHTWCNSEQNALELQTSPAKLHATVVGRTNHNTTYKALCWTTGDQVYAYIYNHDKRSNRWIRVEALNGVYYTPLAWFNVDGNTSSDYVGALPTC